VSGFLRLPVLQKNAVRPFHACLNTVTTLKELFEGKEPKIPLVDRSAFKKAPKEAQGDQDALSF
jgi:hypothetical protein